jgi:hypothetical protein
MACIKLIKMKKKKKKVEIIKDIYAFLYLKQSKTKIYKEKGGGRPRQANSLLQ